MANSRRPADDESLAAHALHDRQAFAVLYDRYFAPLYNYLRMRCGDAQTADDLTALTFERALRHLANYCPQRAPFKTWLFTIARNALNDHLRAQRRHPWLSLEALSRRVLRGADPEERFLHKEQHDQLLAALQDLRERERDLVALKFAAGLTNRQIATISGLSESNVAVIVFRALNRLRSKLENRASPGEENPHERA